MGRVAGKIALVTGAGGGLGRAFCQKLAAEGAIVVCTDINDTTALETAAAAGHDAIGLKHDVTSQDAWAAILTHVKDHFGALHVLVNNAGVGDPGSIEDTSLETWRKVNAVNLDSVFFGIQTCLPLLRESSSAAQGGSIINISSIAGIIAGHNIAAYNATKAAVRHLSKSVALHCCRTAPFVRCNSVHPTFVDTPILTQLSDRDPKDIKAKMARQIPLGRIGRPEEIANGILFLASEESSFMTGAELVLDGGISAM